MPHISVLSTGVLHQEHEPEFLALKDSRACIQENQRLQETDSPLKGHVPNQKQLERSLIQTHLLVLERLPERQEASGT